MLMVGGKVLKEQQWVLRLARAKNFLPCQSLTREKKKAAARAWPRWPKKNPWNPGKI
jgi:hypothetical protein